MFVYVCQQILTYIDIKLHGVCLYIMLPLAVFLGGRVVAGGAEDDQQSPSYVLMIFIFSQPLFPEFGRLSKSLMDFMRILVKKKINFKCWLFGVY